MSETEHNEKGLICNDAILLLLQEKLEDIQKVAKHASSDISHVCVEKEVIDTIRVEAEKQIVMLRDTMDQAESKNGKPKE